MSKILIIDDNPDTRLVLSLGLKMEGHDVFTAEDGDAGLKTQRTSSAELLITDLFMPNKDGMETIAAFRKEFPNVKIIATSGSVALDRIDYLKAARQIGADECLRKPYGLEELYAAISRLLSN